MNNFPGLVKLDKNVVAYSVNDLIEVRSVVDDICRYDHPEMGDFEELIARYCGVSVCNIKLTQGADGGLDSCFQLLNLNHFLIPSPSYVGFEHIARKNNINYDFYKTCNLKETLLNADENTAIVICNPSNPFGDITKNLTKLIDKSKAKIIVDEAYIECNPDESLSTCSVYQDNIFVIRTFSKAFGLPGMRIGYVVSSKNNINRLSKKILKYPLANFSVTASIQVLKQRDKIFIRLEKLIARSKLLSEQVTDLGFDVKTSSTYFFSIKFKNPEYAYYMLVELRKRGVYLCDYHKFSILRVTVGNDSENRYFLKILSEIKNEF